MELVITNLSKTYSNGVQALKNVNLTISNGMFGLLGPNGAGKSTLMRTLATLQEADSGSANLNGINVLKDKEQVRRILGYLPQEFGLYPKVSAETLLNHFAQLKGVHNSAERQQVVAALLHKTNLYEHRKKNLGTYSGGMRQRFGIAQALIGNPQLIIVDEPTAGLDPSERLRFHNLLSEIGENIVVILSTHIIDDVESLCQNMAIIDRGEVIMHATPGESIAQMKGKIWRKLIEKNQEENYRQYNIISIHLKEGKYEITVNADSNPDGTFESVIPNLSDVYFSLFLPQN